jgi:type IV pilus assembly protein PilX
MIAMFTPRLSNPRLPHRQDGLVLVIALIVLVAMTLVAIGTMRSVDTNTVVAGNLAFKQSTLNGTDAPLEDAYRWLATNASGSTLYNDNAGSGYFSAVGAEVDWTDQTNWIAGNVVCTKSCAADANGNTAYYIIHRMCGTPGQPPGGSNVCATVSSGGGTAEGNSTGYQAAQFQPPPSVYYRITARVVGPRNSVSVVQTFVAM